MTEALYRKWRPKLWDEIISQEHIVRTLKNAVTSNHLAHAYIFTGPRGTGKTTAARLLAKAVNCLDPDLSHRPCNECAHCVAVNQNRFMDLIEIDAASNNGVDDVRDLIEKINFSPSQGTYRVYIVDEVHMLSTGAFNALLKTLEEPPPHVIFILATTEIHKIPATVLSRCQRHEFRRVPHAEITRHLKEICKSEGIDADPEALSSIARQASGGMRDAISLLDQLSSTGNKITIELAQSVLGTATSQSVLDLVQAIVDRQPGAGLDVIHLTLDAGADVRSFTRQIVDYLRNIMLIKMQNGEQVEVPNEIRKQMNEHANALSLPEVLRMMRVFNVAAMDQRGGWTPSLGLELAFVEVLEPPAQAWVGLEPSPTAPAVRATAAKTVQSQAVDSARTQPPVRQNPFREQAKANVDTVPNSANQVQTVRLPEKATETGPAATPHASVIQPQAAAPQQKSNDEPAAQAAAGLPITMDQASKAWKQIGNMVKAKYPNLSGLINSGKLTEIRAGKLVISFSSDLLREKFDQPENIDLTKRALQKALNLKIDIPIQTTVSGARNALPAHVNPDGMVAAATQLGGELVDSQ